MIRNAIKLTKHQLLENKSKLQSLSYSLYDKAFIRSYSTEGEYMKNNLSSKTNYNSRLSSANRVSLIKRSKESNSAFHQDKSFNNKITFGERLYHKGIVMQKASFEKTKILQSKLLKNVMTHCTFKPKILKVIGVEKCYDYLKPNKKNKKPSTRNNYTNTTSETNQLHSQSSSSKMSNGKTNTFYKQSKSNNHNNMNINLTKLQKQIEYNKPELILHSIKLYNDDKRIKNKQQEIRNRFFSHHYFFKPIISKSQNKVAAKQVYQKDSIINFFHRLQSWLDNHEKIFHKAQEEEFYDRDTGYRLYSPQINHISLSDTNHQNYQMNSTILQNRCNALYCDALKRKSKSIKIESNCLESIVQISNSSFFSPRSKEIIDILLRKIFNKFFEIISPNGSYVDKNSILLEIVDEKVIEIFYPLLHQLEEQNLTLNEEQFYSACIVLYDTLSVLEKNIILEWYFTQCKREQNEKGGKNMKSHYTFKSNAHTNSRLSCLNNISSSIKNKSNDKSNEKDNSFMAKKDFTCFGGEVCTFRPNEYPTICNITPIDIDIHYKSNRITEEI